MVRHGSVPSSHFLGVPAIYFALPLSTVQGMYYAHQNPLLTHDFLGRLIAVTFGCIFNALMAISTHRLIHGFFWRRPSLLDCTSTTTPFCTRRDTHAYVHVHTGAFQKMNSAKADDAECKYVSPADPPNWPKMAESIHVASPVPERVA